MGLYSALFRSFFKLDYRVDLPGLEVKYACEAAEKVGAKIHFMGAELNSDSAKRLAHETRLTLLDYLRQRFMHKNSLWTYERNNNQQKQLLVGPAAYTEKCMDQNQNSHLEPLSNTSVGTCVLIQDTPSADPSPGTCATPAQTVPSFPPSCRENERVQGPRRKTASGRERCQARSFIIRSLSFVYSCSFVFIR